MFVLDITCKSVDFPGIINGVIYPCARTWCLIVITTVNAALLVSPFLNELAKNFFKINENHEYCECPLYL